MSYYKLKKDLPFAKAGTRIDSIRFSGDTEKLYFIQIGAFKCEFPEEKTIFDWIVEVKPKEVADECIGSLQKVIDKLKIAEEKTKNVDALVYAQLLIKAEMAEFHKSKMSE